jgi:hypothetical protein
MTCSRGSALLRMFALFAVLGGCGPDVQTICEDREACTGGNEKDVEACVEGWDAQGDLADELGCSDEYAEYADCFEQSAECIDEPSGGNCAGDGDCGQFERCANGQCVRRDYDFPNDTVCQAERSAYNNCGGLNF